MKRIEYSLHVLILLSLAGLYIILVPQHSLLFNAHMLIFLSGSSFLFYSQALWLVPKHLLSRRYKKYIVFSLGSSTVCVLIMLGSKLPAFAADWYNRYYNIVAYSEIITQWRWIALDGIIDSALIMFALGLAYGYLRNRRYPDWLIFRKILPSVSLLTIGCLLCGLWHLIWDQEFRHYPAPVQTEITEINPDIHILECTKEYPGLGDIVSDSQIDGKPLYVMLWSMGCSSMYYYMNILKKMKKEYCNDDLKYVYICGEVTSTKAQWLRSISLRDIEGYHLFLTRKQFHRLFIDEIGISNGTPACILVGRDGAILDKELPRLSKRVPLAEQIGNKITISSDKSVEETGTALN